ncbi:hypothetical protein ACFXPI_05700 [Streptomyces sp. NPDC059104]|uniref:hypothetical protein n=1 Tax=Streptomyces sp. NPDC059104 TaxID=3346729 RepID=UPI0036A5347D
MAAHLIIIGGHEPLAWVLDNQRMAFSAGSRSQGAAAPAKGDEILLYTTRDCFRRPTRNRGRIMGLATVTSETAPLADKVVFGGRRFTTGCTLRVHGLAPRGEGVVLADLVTQLEVFPDPRHWSLRMRRASLQLPDTDADFLRRELQPTLRPYRSVLGEYAFSPALT